MYDALALERQRIEQELLRTRVDHGRRSDRRIFRTSRRHTGRR